MDKDKLAERNWKKLEEKHPGKTRAEISKLINDQVKEITDEIYERNAADRQDKINKLAKLGSFNVFDAETEKWVEVTPEAHQEFEFRRLRMAFSQFQFAADLKEILDKKLYLAGKFQTKQDFYDSMKISRSQASRYYLIADKLLPKLENAEHTQVVSPAKHAANTSEKLKNLSTDRAYEIVATLNNAELDDFINEGKIKIGDKELDIDEIREMTRKEFRSEINDLKKRNKKYSDRISQVEESYKLLQAETKITFKENEALKKKNEELTFEQMRLGPKASVQKDKIYRLDRAWRLLIEVNELVVTANITEDDHESLITKLLHTIDEFDEIKLRLQEVYALLVGQKDYYLDLRRD